MKPSSKAAAGLLAISILAGSAGSASGAEVTQLIEAGGRTASVTNVELPAVTYSNLPQANSGTMTLTADDSSATGLGWNVTVQSSDFVHSGGGSDIPASNFWLTAAGAPVSIAGGLVDLVGGPLIPAISPIGPLDVARKTISAAPLFGQGIYTQALGVSLNVPAQSKPGTYTSTLTTTVSAGP